MTNDEWFDLATKLGGYIDSYNKQVRAYAVNLKALQDADPCVKGFDEKLDALDQEAEANNAFAQDTLIPAYQEVINGYNSLDRKTNAIVSAVKTIQNSVRSIGAFKDELKKNGTRADLRERYNSCEVLKDPEDPPSDEEVPPEDQEDDGENQSEDDQGDSNENESYDSPDTSTPSTTTTQSGKSDTPAANKSPKPNRRQKNPLGNLSSYTYILTLYMVTPEAYAAFIASGRKDINAFGDGVHIVAQSGGINNNSEKRASAFKYDYYIDNLKINSKISGKESGSAATTTGITFDIIEPYGFSFLSNLRRSKDYLLQTSQVKNIKENTKLLPELKQFYVLGIRFYGYDKNGNIATTAQFTAPDQINPASKTSGGDTALFERFYDMKIYSAKFKLDGKSTTYNIEAKVTAEQVAFTNRLGRINKDIKVQAFNVYGALMGNNAQEIGLLASLNNEQKKLFEEKTISIPNEYAVEFIGNSDDLKFAQLALSSDLDKSRSAMTARSVKDINPAIEVKAIPNLDAKLIQFKTDTSILQAISLIIAQSEYLYKAQQVVGTSEADPDNEDEAEQKPKSPGTRIRWYNIGAKVEVLGYDLKRQDYSYKITYVIQPYETPWFETPLANKGIPYYGPHKRYKYFYTGENTEVIRYEQQINNAYYTIALQTNPDPEAKTSSAPVGIPIEVNRHTGEARTGSTGEFLEAQNAYLTSLYDPKSWATAKVNILGDPDFLMETSPSNIAQVYDPYYGNDRFTIHPNGGQVFIEIDFKEPDDYHHTDGLLSINESIGIVPIPDELKKPGPTQVQGVSYMVIDVVSTFRGGKFEQELNCIINNWGGMNFGKSKSNTNNQREDNTTVGTRQGTKSDKPTVGLASYDPPDSEDATSDTPYESSVTENEPQTQSSDDDAGG